MKGWHVLLPILGILWTVLIVLAVIDHNGQKESTAVNDKPLSMEQRLELRVAELNSSRQPRVCGTYISRAVGVYNSYGIVCVESGLEVFYTGIGLTKEYTQEHYDLYILPVVDNLHREYRKKYGWRR